MAKSKHLSSTLGLGLALGAALALLAPANPATASMFECTDEGNLCFEQIKGSRWFSGAKTNAKMRKKRSKSNPGAITLEIEGGRGSMFINGRYAGTAPLDGVEVPSGPNDIQVRDGSEVLAWGIFTVPAGGNVKVTVRHP